MDTLLAISSYLDKVVYEIRQTRQVPSITVEDLDSARHVYAILLGEPSGQLSAFVIQFASGATGADTSDLNLTEKLQLVTPGGATFIGYRILLTDPGIDLMRPIEMATAIFRQYQIARIPSIQRADTSVFENSRIIADWDITTARKTARELSPHGVPSRMEVGMTLFVKPLSEPREFDYTPLGVIGGYVDFLEKEIYNVKGRDLYLYTPVFHITVWDSYLPMNGSLAMLLAAFAPSIYHDKKWLDQWKDAPADKPSLGTLMEDHKNPGHHFVLTDDVEIEQFAAAYCASPQIMIDVQNGRNSLPKDWVPALIDHEKAKPLLASISSFFRVSSETIPTDLVPAVLMAEKKDGVIRSGSNLADSRVIDFAYMVERLGLSNVTADIRNAFLQLGRPKEKTEFISEASGSFVPLYDTAQLLVTPDFARWLVKTVSASGLVFVDAEADTNVSTSGSVRSAVFNIVIHDEESTQATLVDVTINGHRVQPGDPDNAKVVEDINRAITALQNKKAHFLLGG